jgi:hypothetical protein
MIRRIILLTALLGLAAGGCATQETFARSSAEQFNQALSGGDAITACALLTPTARRTIERQQGRECPEVITKQLQAQRMITGVTVDGGQAQVRQGPETLILANDGDHWLVSAAGCRTSAVGYSCTVDGG